MSKPIRVFYSPLSQRFYASRAWKVTKKDDESEHVFITGEKFDVTDDIGRAIKEHDLEFTPVKRKAKP